ncbi:MAG: porin [Pseudomonadota bacterium]
MTIRGSGSSAAALAVSMTVSAAMLPASGMAAEIGAGGALDVTLGGRGDFGVRYSDSELRGGAPGSAAAREWDYRNDMRLDFRAHGVGDATGLEYGFFARIRTRSGSGDPSNIESGLDLDQTWIYFGSADGDYGEARLGTQEAVTELNRITATNVAAGTGGIDGDQREAPDDRIDDSGKTTKALLLSPVIAGFRLSGDFGFDDADKGRFTADEFGQQAPAYAASLNYAETFGPVKVGGYAGYAGGNGRGVTARNNYQFGGEVQYLGIGVAGSYGKENNSTGSDGRDNFWNVGVGGGVGIVDLSFNFQRNRLRRPGTPDSRKSQDYYVISGTLPILPGVQINADVGYINGPQVESDGVVGSGNGMDAILELRTRF